MRKTTGAAVAIAAASLFMAAPASTALADSHGGGVKCMGANACKGHSACATAEHACKGQNSCKGHGWVKTSSAEECKEKGGTVAEE